MRYSHHFSPRAGCRVLMVDDDPDVRRLLDRLLSHWGYVTSEAGTAQAGLERALEWRPDLVIIDLHLPDMDGRQLANLLLRTPDQPPVIMLTGSQIDPVPGVVAVLLKPFDIQALRRIVSRHSRASGETRNGRGSRNVGSWAPA